MAVCTTCAMYKGWVKGSCSSPTGPASAESPAPSPALHVASDKPSTGLPPAAALLKLASEVASSSDMYVMLPAVECAAAEAAAASTPQCVEFSLAGMSLTSDSWLESEVESPQAASQSAAGSLPSSDCEL